MTESRKSLPRYLGIAAASAFALAALAGAVVPCEPYQPPPRAFTIVLIVALVAVFVGTLYALAATWLGASAHRAARPSPVTRSLVMLAAAVLALVAAAVTWVLVGGIFLVRCGA